MATFGLQQTSLVFVSLILLGPYAALATKARTASTMQDDTAAPGGTAVQKDEGVSERANKRIDAVVTTLQDISQSITTEGETEGKNWYQYEKWCVLELDRITQEIDFKEPSLRGADAGAAEKTASIASTQHALKSSEQTHVETLQMLQQGKKVRDEENDKYKEDMLLNQQSISQVENAISMVNKVQIRGGFLQGGKVQRLQVNEPGESSYVLGIMKQLKNQLVATRTSMQTEEGEKQATYDKLVQAKQQQANNAESDIAFRKSEITSLEVQNLDNKRAQGRLPSEISDLKALHEEVDAACKDKAKAWDIRKADRVKELYTLGEAIKYIQSKAGMFFIQKNLQASNDEVAASFLQQSSTSSSLDKQVEQASYAEAKKAVKELASVLETTQAKEDEMFKRCQKNLAEKTGELSDTQDEMSQLFSQYQAKMQEGAKIGTEIDGINKDITNAQGALTTAKQIRKQEKETYEAGSKDRSLAIKVLKQANEVLRMFYSTADNTAAALLQAGKQAAPDPANLNGQLAPKTWTGTTRHDIGSKSVVGMIDEVIVDIEAEQRSADSYEQNAEDDLAKLVKNSTPQFDANMLEITNRDKRKAKLLVQMASHQEDHTTKTEEAKGISGEVAALHQECDELIQFYEARKKARRNEVDQLRDAYDILSGSSVASRTGLLQEVAGVMAAAAAPIQDVAH